jgi:hypothetical protein
MKSVTSQRSQPTLTSRSTRSVRGADRAIYASSALTHLSSYGSSIQCYVILPSNSKPLAALSCIPDAESQALRRPLETQASLGGTIPRIFTDRIWLAKAVNGKQVLGDVRYTESRIQVW